MAGMPPGSAETSRIAQELLTKFQLMPKINTHSGNRKIIPPMLFIQARVRAEKLRVENIYMYMAAMLQSKGSAEHKYTGVHIGD